MPKWLCLKKTDTTQLDIPDNKINSQDEKILFQMLTKKHQNSLQQICESINITKYNQLIESKKLEDIINKQQYQYAIFNDSIQKKETQLKHKYDCTICYERHFDTVLVPCGHVICQQCSNTATHCYFCRMSIKLKQKIYLNP